MNENPIPCPFCGVSSSYSEDTITEEGGMERDWRHINCDNLFCFAEMRCLFDISKEELIKAWNKRV